MNGEHNNQTVNPNKTNSERKVKQRQIKTHTFQACFEAAVERAGTCCGGRLSGQRGPGRFWAAGNTYMINNECKKIIALTEKCGLCTTHFTW